MIHDEIVTFEVAKLAKEKGFSQDPKENDNCQIYCWDNLRKIHPLCISAMWYTGEFNCEDMYAAPTQSLLQRWLREEKRIDIAIVPSISMGYSYIVYDILDRDNRVVRTKVGYKTYELALEDAELYCLKNLL